MFTKQELSEIARKSVDANSLRAGVLGGNDGLVSNFSLIMGVAGASNTGNEVIIAGTAGLLAGALSMAMGEWISVKSAQEMYEHQIRTHEDVSISDEELNSSPMRAASSSFVLFCIGAILPLFPFFFTSGNQAIMISGMVSTIGLFVIGALITLLTGKNIWYSGLRQVIFGVGAASISYGIGTLFGITVL